MPRLQRISGPPVARLLALLAFGLFAAPAQAQSAGEHDSVAPLRVAIALGPGKKPLEKFARHREKNYHIQCEFVEAAKAKNEQPTPFQNLQALEDCDVIVSNLYRTWAPPDELTKLKKHFRNKPVVGLRKAHHGFQNWLQADQEVCGVDYRGHYFGKNVSLKFAEGAERSPLLAELEIFLPAGGLYQHLDVREDVEVYLVGGPQDKQPLPQTWLRVVKSRDNQRVFYTRYDPEDLDDPGVRTMVSRAIFWAAGKVPADYRR